MLLTFWQDGLYIISLCQRYCAELLICFLCTYCLVFVFFDKDFLLSKKKKKKKHKNKQRASLALILLGFLQHVPCAFKKILSFFFFFSFYFYFYKQHMLNFIKQKPSSNLIHHDEFDSELW